MVTVSIPSETLLDMFTAGPRLKFAPPELISKVALPPLLNAFSRETEMSRPSLATRAVRPFVVAWVPLIRIKVAISPVETTLSLASWIERTRQYGAITTTSQLRIMKQQIAV